MANNVYSDYETAKEMAEEKMKELECDIFICKSKFQSGEEFTLKTIDEMSCSTYLHIISLPFRHHFVLKKNAEREASKFISKKGVSVYVNKKTEIVNGYVTIKYYYLTHKECLT